MPTLYTQSEKNIRKTYLYLFGFFIFIIALGWVISYLVGNHYILYFAILFSIVMSFGSYWWSDKLVLKMTKAIPVKKEDNPELYRVTENLSISAGIPMPRLYILNDDQPNAFATGRNPEHGVIVVTSGLLKMLERVELEGVIAHEMAHIGNRDILISTVVVVLVGVVVLVANIFFRMVFFGRIGKREGGANVFLLVGAVIFLILSPLLAQLMKLAISRNREYLADSTGALITRYPEGLARALEKISTYPGQLRTANDATAHMYISNPFRGKEKNSFVHKLFMTHPSTEDRIKKLRSNI